MLRSSLLVGVAALLLLAPTAGASTVHLAGDSSDSHVVITAGPGERNSIVVTTADFDDPVGGTGTGARISDAAGIQPSGAPFDSGCTSVSPTVVQCFARGTIDAELGDRDDSLDAGAYAGPVDATGGPGSDTIIGGSGPDALWGDLDRSSAKGGRDHLVGGAGDDALYGGAGDDVITAGAGDDVMSGAQGHDVEDGGPGDDQLDNYGIDGDLAGAEDGPDTLRGGPGRDQIHAVTKGDRVSAGPGDDAVVAVQDSGTDNRSRQVVDCGAGQDAVEVGSHDDVKACERPFFERFCFPGPRCTAHWLEARGHRVLGRGMTKKMLGLRMYCRIVLGPAGRRLERRPGGVTVDVFAQLKSGRTLFAPARVIRGLRLRT